jgi:proteasome accessory factor C
MARIGADERLRRLLAMIPWIAAHDGPTIAEVCSRFDVTEKELLADLDLLWMCGLYPYTPDMLIEVDIADDRVWIRYAEYFNRPLRLTPAEGLALVGAGQALLAAPGTDPEGPLARGLATVATVLGVGGGEALDVDLGAAPAGVLATLQQAAAGHRQVELDYYSFGRDEWTTRVVDPWRVFNAAGQWYLAGHCHRAGAERLFRVDRVRSAVTLDTAIEVPATSPSPLAGADPPVYSPRPDDPVVVLELARSAHWVRDQYPNEGVKELRCGRLRVRLRVSELAWLDRLLLRLGRNAKVVQGDTAAVDKAARRILVRYQDE